MAAQENAETSAKRSQSRVADTNEMLPVSGSHPSGSEFGRRSYSLEKKHWSRTSNDQSPIFEDFVFFLLSLSLRKTDE